MIAVIEIYGGHIMLIDAADYDLIKGTSWSVQYQYKDGVKLLDFPSCVRGWVNGKTTSIHAVLMNPPKGMKVDHIMGVKGVSPTTNGRFKAQIKVDGKHRELGVFDDIASAKQAYDQAAKQHFGEFARFG